MCVCVCVCVARAGSWAIVDAGARPRPPPPPLTRTHTQTMLRAACDKVLATLAAFGEGHTARERARVCLLRGRALDAMEAFDPAAEAALTRAVSGGKGRVVIEGGGPVRLCWLSCMGVPYVPRHDSDDAAVPTPQVSHTPLTDRRINTRKNGVGGEGQAGAVGRVRLERAGPCLLEKRRLGRGPRLPAAGAGKGACVGGGVGVCASE